MKKAGEEIGSHVGNAGLSKAGSVWGKIKDKLAKHPDGVKTVQNFETSPEDNAVKEEFLELLKQNMHSDKIFASELQSEMETALEYSDGVIFQNDIHGSVQKVVQVNNVFGDMTFV